MRIGVFGGSFNPPHKMHKDIVLYLLENKYLDKIIIVPVGDNYNKKDLAPFTNRIDMLKLNFNDVDYVEISELESTGQKYTYETLDYFKNKYYNDEIYFICGSDNLNEINTWKNYKYILNNYKILVIKRNNDNVKKIIRRISGNIVVVNKKEYNVSSTYIRDCILLNKKEKIIDIINKDVLEYIEKEKIYEVSYGKINTI